MQLDKTEIVIRQRSSFELLDLALRVVRRHWLKIVWSGGILGIPLLVINALVTMWMKGEDAILAVENFPEPELYISVRHTCHMIGLWILEFPLATLPVTVLLGNQLFFQPLTGRQLQERLKPIAWRSLLVLGILRMGLVGILLELFFDQSQPFDPLWETGLILCLLAALFIRGVWPFAPEILGLELCHLKKSADSPISYTTRRNTLHQSGDHIARFAGTCMWTVVLFGSLITSWFFIVENLTGSTSWNGLFEYLVLPLTLWIVGLFIAIFRFLAYLDTRIRLEGWEIELRLRAEGQRLLAQENPLEIKPSSKEQVVA